MKRALRRAVAAGFIAVAAAACASHPGGPVAEMIQAANSPIAREVRYTPAVFGASASQDSRIVVLVDGTAESARREKWR